MPHPDDAAGITDAEFIAREIADDLSAARDHVLELCRTLLEHDELGDDLTDAATALARIENAARTLSRLAVEVAA